MRIDTVFRLAVVASVLAGTFIDCRRNPSGSSAGGSESKGRAVTILNVSYDPTRELYDEINGAFTKAYLANQGVSVKIEASHGGSGKQARAVLDGLEADVVTLGLGYDIDVLAQRGKLLPTDWQSRLPQASTPYTSTVVFVVRKGNPKGIRDWDDLVKDGVAIVTPNPKTSGGARWNYLAAYGYALRRPDGSADRARAFVTKLYRNAPVLDSGARGATTSFAERNIGDVLVAWENEALLLTNGPRAREFEIVVPSESILAEPPVAIVDRYVDKHGTREVATAYASFLFSHDAQEIAARHYFRPRDPSGIAPNVLARFKDTPRFTVQEVFGSWEKAQREHFDEGAVFDRITTAAR